MHDLSPRLAEIFEALPLRPGLRVIEIGGAPGTLGRLVAERVGATGFVMEIDRSARGIAQIERLAAAEIACGRLGVRRVAVEDFELLDGEARYDLAFAIRVGALDGRHPELGRRAIARLNEVLVPGGRLFVDGGDPLREVALT